MKERVDEENFQGYFKMRIVMCSLSISGSVISVKRESCLSRDFSCISRR